MWDVSLSTMWGLKQFDHLQTFFEAGEEIGFAKFELNHGVDSKMLNSLNLNGYAISSVHEPCPADISGGELNRRDWLISSPDEDNRQQGMRAIRRSIDLARQLKAQVVVVHAGQTHISPKLERHLWDLFEAGKADTPEYIVAKETLVSTRAANSAPHLDAVEKSLKELADYAGEAGVRLALENRYRYHNFPLPDELEYLFSVLDADVVGYCHDAGHAQTFSNVGLIPHEEWLKRFAHRMFEVHLHDVNGVVDHTAPGRGNIDWDMLVSYLPDDAIRTFEIREHNTPEQTKAALLMLAEKGGIKAV